MKLTADMNATLAEVRSYRYWRTMTPEARREFEVFALDARTEDPAASMDEIYDDFLLINGFGDDRE